jgi:hypothetical protein
MEFGTSGMLNEGPSALHKFQPRHVDGGTDPNTDGIHVDMDRLKKGEVK